MIIAIDFDGILCKNEFPKIGDPNYDVITLVKQLTNCGHEVILWTSRNGQELKDAVEWGEQKGLYFCAINDNAPSNKKKYAGIYETETRKIYADIYVDDHNLEFQVGSYASMDAVKRKLKMLID